VHQVQLTEQGETLFYRLATAARAHDQRLRAGPGDEEIASLEHLLARLHDNWPFRTLTRPPRQPGTSGARDRH